MASPEYSCPPRKSRPLQASYIRGYGFNLRLPSSTCGRYIQSLDCVYLLFWRIPIHQAPLQSSKSSILLRQMMTTVVLNGLIYTKCEMYLDDCIVFARGHDEFLERLERVFRCFRCFGLSLKAKKCRFGMKQIDYVGRQISSQGISMSKEKIKSVLNFPKPKSLTASHSFLVLA